MKLEGRNSNSKMPTVVEVAAEDAGSEGAEEAMIEAGAEEEEASLTEIKKKPQTSLK